MMKSLIILMSSLLLQLLLVLLLQQQQHQFVTAREYYYTRTRRNPQHLRVAEEFKNNYVGEIRYESLINGTKYEYYKSSLSMSHDELVFETIDKIFQHRLSPFYIHQYDNDEDRRRSSDPALVSPDKCARDLMYLVDKLPKRINARQPYTNIDEDHLTPELTAFFDSYARQEPGLLMGNTYWVGAYDQCVNRHIFELSGSTSEKTYHHRKQDTMAAGLAQENQQQQQVVSFQGRYCVSSLKSPTWDSIIAKKKIESRKYFKSERQFDNYAKLFRLQVGICLPSSCDSNSLSRHKDEIKLLTTAMMEQRYSDYELIDLYCIPDESSPLRAWSGGALYFLIFILSWCLLLFMATCADMFNIEETLPKGSKVALLVNCLSLRANYRKLMKVNLSEDQQLESNKQQQQRQQQQSDESKTSTSPSSPSPTQQTEMNWPINLRFLNAFKALIMFWIINGHIMLLMIQTAKNILYSDALLNGLMHFLIGATFGVDLFFTMTGFLTSYLIFNSGHAYKMKPATWIYLSVHRYWRLAPMYLISFWFSRSVAQQLGTGPLWDYGTSSLTFRGLCNHESWWYPLTLTSNLHGLFEECMITSWYISCDMQFWLISPIFIYLLAKKPLHGWMASIATIAMSSKVRYDAILEDESARYDELVQPRADIFMRVSHDLPALYTHPHYRISAYIVGLLAGHYVYMIKSGKWSSSIYKPTSVQQQQHQQQQLVEENQLKSMMKATPEEENAGIKEGKAKLQPSGKTKQKASKISKRSSLGKIEAAESISNGGATRATRVGENNIRVSGTRRKQLIAYTGLFLFSVMSFISYLLSHYYPSSLLDYAKQVAAVAYSVDHLAMSIGASLIIISMCFGLWSNIVKFLSHPHWTRLSKLNYALLLLQCEAIYFQIFRFEQVPLAGTRELISILFNLLVTLYPLALLVTVAFEFPLANLEKLLHKRK